MRRTWLAVLVLAAVGLTNTVASAVEVGSNRIGAGANYWVAVDSLNSSTFDRDGLSYFVSYQYQPELFGFDLTVEMLPDRFGRDALAPQAYIMLGQTLYLALGIGIVYANDDFADEPFYALKTGLDMELLPNFFVDISANYRFNETSQLKDRATNIDTDTVFLGAAIRIGL